LESSVFIFNIFLTSKPTALSAVHLPQEPGKYMIFSLLSLNVLLATPTLLASCRLLESYSSWLTWVQKVTVFG